MSNVLKGLMPEKVFQFFEELTQIPRGSGNEKGVSDYLVKFAKDRNLEVIQDDILNVIIKKPASKGYEKAPSVILQGHCDIVCAKEEGLKFDFEKDPIDIYVDGDVIRTKGTTLGADNGIAVAMSMAILDSKDMMHPEITALVTISEETGMDGVLGLEKGLVKGDVLINIDSEEEGTALSSCAGGVDNIVKTPIIWNNDISENTETLEISIRGLLGGHSGMEINKNRANAIKLMGRLLEEMKKDIKLNISDINGGEKMNAIAKFAIAKIVMDKKDSEDAIVILEKFEKIINNEFKTSDPNIKVEGKKITSVSKYMNDSTTKNIIDVLRLIPFGIQTMSADIEGLVESSLNIGVLTTDENEVIFNSAVRSSVRSLKEEINSRIQIIADLTNSKMELHANYPEWEFKPVSDIREKMKSVYKDMYGKSLKIDAIHAGLECGLLKEKVGDIDMISIGPNIYDVHTPNEHLSISSTRRVYEFLCEVLKRMK
ncbi:aminoacyl-histidine dipeptidase [Helicovermis profundi]|uniref:Cytosol non-specific dipeptidase n=1 Tax=Helicovermis profundi TaxID=3065157 RepID=A0AAU9E5M0_9FIRM|nr:aminoacyl-histidine dipeptidase [Clostridia bacterium S502]